MKVGRKCENSWGLPTSYKFVNPNSFGLSHISPTAQRYILFSFFVHKIRTFLYSPLLFVSTFPTFVENF